VRGLTPEKANAQCATPTTKAQLRLLKNPAPTPTITVPAL